MSDVLALWGSTLKDSRTVYWQFLVADVALGFALGLPLAIGDAVHAFWIFLPIAIVFGVPVGAYTLGATMGAVGETIRGEPRSDYFDRAGRFYVRALGLVPAVALGLAFQQAIDVIFVELSGAVAVLQPAGALAAVEAVSAAFGSAFPWVVGAMFVALCLVVPFLFALQAGVFAGDLRLQAAFSQAVGEAYSRAHLGHWAFVVLVAIASEVILDALNLLGVVGQITAMLAGPALAWASVALVLSVWQVHKRGAGAA